MVTRWKTLAGSEIKSRLYLSLIEKKLNITKLAEEYDLDEENKHFTGYSRKHIGNKVREMDKEGILKSQPYEKTSNERGRKIIKRYTSDITVYTDYLNQMVGIKEKQLQTVKEIIKGYSKILNKIGTADMPDVNAIWDISLSCALPEYFTVELPTKKQVGELFSQELEETGEYDSKILYEKYLPIYSKALTGPLVNKLFQYPQKDLLSDKTVKKAKENKKHFILGIRALPQTSPDHLPSKLAEKLKKKVLNK